jgi:glycerophosphoryl diester phosphodiesterase
MIELDVAMTKDHELIVMHDPSVERTTDGKGRIADLTLRMIKRLDAGSWMSSVFKGERVPTLKEALEIMPVNIWLNVHVKGTSEVLAGTARLIVAQDRLSQAFVACEGDMKAIQKVDPRVKICLFQNVHDTLLSESDLVESDFVQVYDGITDSLPEIIRAMKLHGIRVNYFGTDSQYELRKLYDVGVDFPLVNDVAEMMKEASRLGIQPIKPKFRQ